jgi:predicted secreted hydrolase
MKSLLVSTFIVIVAMAGADARPPGEKYEWRVAMPGWQYEFPRDHHAHPEFKTEWWYFTGNLFDERGRRFGYELTFFRQGIIPPAERDRERSRFVVNDLKFAHFTITDASGREFLFNERASRGAFDDAGFDHGDVVAWINDWSLKMNAAGEFELMANSGGSRGRSPSQNDKPVATALGSNTGGRASRADCVLDLVLTSVKPPVIHGEGGVSGKAVEEGHASHYYSSTRLTSLGTLRLDDRKFKVSGTSWFDHEWATNQLAPHQLGWNWLCVQFDNNTELMLYQMRRDDGTFDPASSGTFVAPGGAATHLRADDFSVTSNGSWRSSNTDAVYPARWRVQVPSHGIDITVLPVLNDQELALAPLIYWEGAVDVSGSAKGVGYLELTGYAGTLSAINR